MQLIAIGNSKGVRIPKAIIEQANLQNSELSFKVLDSGLLISPIKKQHRANWQGQIKKSIGNNQELSAEDTEWLEADLDNYE
jgi:antitoxin MazE